MNLRAIKRIKRTNAHVILGTSSEGFPCYYYVRMHPDKLKTLERLPAGTELDITELGEVLERGYGEPPDELL